MNVELAFGRHGLRLELPEDPAPAGARWSLLEPRWATPLDDPGAAIAQASQLLGPIGALPWPASASVAHLKVNGTAMVANLAAKISTVANTTRAFRSGRLAGQM